MQGVHHKGGRGKGKTDSDLRMRGRAGARRQPCWLDTVKLLSIMKSTISPTYFAVSGARFSSSGQQQCEAKELSEELLGTSLGKLTAYFKLLDDVCKGEILTPSSDG